MTRPCIVCSGNNLESIFSADRVPVCPNAPLTADKLGRELISNLDIVQCTRCSHIFNRSFDPAIIEKMYEEDYSSGLPLSPKVLEKYENIITQFITLPNIKGKEVLEIGASDFTFSEKLLCHGATRVLAFEPSNLFNTSNPRIRHVSEYFSAKTMPNGFDNIGLVVLRHVLEHVTAPASLLQDISTILKPGEKFYVEVPNADDIISKNRFYDFFYEHISYFRPIVLQQLLRSAGFRSVNTFDLAHGQHFGMLCEKTHDPETGLGSFSGIPTDTATVSRFKAESDRALSLLKDIFFSPDGPMAIYGAGNHAIYVAALLHLDRNRVRWFLDLNPLKHGFFSPLTHIPITAPSSETIAKLNTIVIIASLHQDEIHRDLRNKYEFKGRLFGTYPDVRELE